MKSNSGFSLIETTIAVALVATVMVSVVALLPLGFSTMRRATDLSTQARIAQEIIAEIQLSDWDKLEREFSSESNRMRYYDSQGVELRNASEIGQVYTARIYIHSNQGADFSNLQLPGDPDSVRKPHLRQVIIRITHIEHPNIAEFLDEERNRGRYTQYSGSSVKLRNDFEQ